MTNLLRQTYITEYADWDEEITCHISETLKNDIRVARLLLQNYEFILSVSINVPKDFIDKDTYSKLNRILRIGYEYIEVFKEGIEYNIQGKYDSLNQAGYELYI